MKQKINKMSTKQLISAVQNCIKTGDRNSTYFLKLNAALPVHYRLVK